MNLSPIQKILLRMINDFDNFCKENNIIYYIGGGTLLGAVREKGFIKWDDDIDVMMDRENYEKFISIAHGLLDEKYFLQCSEKDPLWHYHYSKIRLNGTVYATKFSNQFNDMHQGAFFDIFVQDNTANTVFFQKVHIVLIRLWRAVVRYIWKKNYGNEEELKYKKIMSYITKFISLNTAKQKSLKVMSKYKNVKTKYLIDSSGMHLKEGAYPKYWLGIPQYLQFENLILPAPKEYCNYLKYLYGNDYMRPKKYEHVIEKIEL